MIRRTQETRSLPKFVSGRDGSRYQQRNVPCKGAANHAGHRPERRRSVMCARGTKRVMKGCCSYTMIRMREWSSCCCGHCRAFYCSPAVSLYTKPYLIDGTGADPNVNAKALLSAWTRHTRWTRNQKTAPRPHLMAWQTRSENHSRVAGSKEQEAMGYSASLYIRE